MARQTYMKEKKRVKQERQAKRKQERYVQEEKRDFVPLELKPQNYNQERYMSAIDNDNVVIAYGYAGTGKTFVSAAMAADMYMEGTYNKIILTRPNVSCGEDMGHLPGSDKEKIEPWLKPYMTAIKSRMSHGTFECALKNNNIEYMPLQLMRGSSFDNCVILCDESQNITKEQMKMITTRVGKNCKLLINGDTNQSDLKGDNGLAWLLKIIKQYNMPIETIEFERKDCVRSDTCKMFLDLYSRLEE